MPAIPFNHGSQVISMGEDSRPLSVADNSDIGAAVTAPDLDTSVFPYEEPFHFFTHEAEKVAALGPTGTAIDVVRAIRAQGIEGSVVMVAVEEGTDADATRAKLAGSTVYNGVQALRHAAGHMGVEPDLILSPGYSAGRIGGNKNPLADSTIQVAEALKSMAILSTGGATKEDARAFRADFSSRYAYLVHPNVMTLPPGTVSNVAKGADPYVAGLFVKKDKQKGGPYYSPSNQECLGILGLERPISFFDGELDHEANYLNEEGIATFIPAKVVQDGKGNYSPNGSILWGNRTASTDPLWTFVNIVRTRALLEKTVARKTRPFNDENISDQAVVAVIRSLQDLLDEMVMARAILPGARAYWDRNHNTNSSMRSGKVRFEFEAEEAPPMEHLIFGSHRAEHHFDNLAEAIKRKIAVSFSTDFSGNSLD